MAVGACTVLLSCVLVPLLGAVLHTMYVLRTTAAPPSDFGSGAMFDQIAHRYDLTNRVLALNMDTAWRRLMVKEVLDGVLVGDDDDDKVRLLDLATGTADVAILLAEEAQRRGGGVVVTVTGVDPSANMLAVGRTKVAAHDPPIPVTLTLGDAQRLHDHADGSFHGATMAFGIRNVPDRARALCELHRVLYDESSSSSSSRPRRLAVLEFSEPGPGAGVWGAAARVFIRHVVPVLGALLSGKPREYRHLQNSIEAFPSPGDFVKLMETLPGCGANRAFRVDRVHQLNFGSVQLYVATPV